MADTSPLRIALPAYEAPRNAWREKIHTAVSERMEAESVTYSAKDQLALEVCLYMSESMMGFHDVDNRLKDVLDALQGRAGGPKSVRRLRALISNDKQVVRATIEKRRASGRDQSGGCLTIGVVGTTGTTGE